MFFDTKKAAATIATSATQMLQKKPRVAIVADVAADNPQNDALQDLDGVARSPAAIAEVWDNALHRAREFRRNKRPPTCARCGASDWAVSITEPDMRKLHVRCWSRENSTSNEKSGAVR